MLREYSLKSLVFSRFPACYEILSKSVKCKTINMYVRTRLVENDHLESLEDLTESDLPLSIHFLRDGSEASVGIFTFWTLLRVKASGFEETKTDEIFRLIEESLRISEPTEEDYRGISSLDRISELVWRVFDKVEEISNKLQPSDALSQKRFRCFVTFRFDEHSKALAFELKEFLELIGAEFVSGLGFEPRSISEKVLDRLSKPLDLFVVIYSSTGDSSWLNQEIGVARARNLPILVLKEETSVVNLGMLGDTEYLCFPQNNISKAFIGILQALSYLRASGNKA